MKGLVFELGSILLVHRWVWGLRDWFQILGNLGRRLKALGQENLAGSIHLGGGSVHRTRGRTLRDERKEGVAAWRRAMDCRLGELHCMNA